MLKIAAILAAIVLLQGCAAAVVAGGASAVTAANDRRTLGSQIDDNSIVIKARRALSDDQMTAKGSNLNVTSYNGVVLLTGQTSSEQVREQAQRLVQDIPSVKTVHNQIRISNNTSMTTRTRDSWIGTKVKSQLLADEQVSGLNIKVVTENAEVFLMGIVGGSEADRAVNIARNVEGVVRVVKAFENP
ncbi:division/outer membrane stress-associated lipid-binding lipoprotein [Alishewanella tabrizica]|uniref:BON domain-containing protein n=1 Tax=Alishewanella tabrizica TaxID=671278 RepID=A0ABQ2WHI8_9ALTE|nr:division/outer membrane stress-associated lipid-binding lipoprotein [Alishewanella tabrizica]GGW55155.1 BON domain-containing protein [Alishewanella tabrizica]